MITTTAPMAMPPIPATLPKSSSCGRSKATSFYGCYGNIVLSAVRLHRSDQGTRIFTMYAIISACCVIWRTLWGKIQRPRTRDPLPLTVGLGSGDLPTRAPKCAVRSDRPFTLIADGCLDQLQRAPIAKLPRRLCASVSASEISVPGSVAETGSMTGWWVTSLCPITSTTQSSGIELSG